MSGFQIYSITASTIEIWEFAVQASDFPLSPNAYPAADIGLNMPVYMLGRSCCYNAAQRLIEKTLPSYKNSSTTICNGTWISFDDLQKKFY